MLNNNPKDHIEIEEAAGRNGSSSPWSLYALLPLAGLLVAVAFAWLACPIPERNIVSSILLYLASSWPGLFAVATLYIGATVCVSAAAAAVIALILRARNPNRREGWQVFFYGTFATLCLPALVISAAVGSSAIAIGLTVILGINITRLVMADRQIADSNDMSDAKSCLGLLFAQNPSLPGDIPFWRLGVPFVCAILFQVGTVAALTERRLLAAGLVGASAAMLTWRFHRVGNIGNHSSPAYLVRRALRMALLTLFVIVFTMAGMLQYMAAVRGSSGGGSALVNLLHLMFGESPTVAAEQRRQELNQPERTSDPSAVKPDYSGVILIPEARQKAALVVPEELISQAPSSALEPPPEMVFTGVYWIFKPPNMEPPKDSSVITGSPDKIGLRSSDHTPLWMEAHQYLGRAVDVNCCGEIRVVIGNADRYPETVSVQLLVADTQDQIKGIESLGAQLVKSNGMASGIIETKDPSPFQASTSREETLSFDMPQTPTIKRFDEIIVRFHLDGSRSTVNARMAVERFRFTARNSQ
jgi:hypothetical protein